MPLIVTHVYPGTVWEMLPSLPALTDPMAHGGESSDAFDVVVPSIPGFGFSGAPLANTDSERTAELWVALMDRLGYQRFGAYGSDFGAGITLRLGERFPDRLIGVITPGPPPRAARAPRTAEERAYVDSMEQYAIWEAAYQRIQGTKPQSLAYGMTDSPAGVAGWITEKLRAWSDCQGQVENSFSKDEILTLASIYWHTRTIGTSMRYYYSNGVGRTLGNIYERANVATSASDTARPPNRARVPQGYADFIGITSRMRMPRSYVDELPDHVTLWSRHESGGHFPAIEEPELLVEDLRVFFRPLRTA